MTEAEWLTCTTPTEMFAVLGERLTERTCRLFGCCCCQGIRSLLTDERSQRALEVAERFADGNADKDELEEARRNARAAIRYVAGLSYPSSYDRRVAKRSAEAAAELVGKSVRKVVVSISNAVLEASSEAAGQEGSRSGAYAMFRSTKLQTDRAWHSQLIREIFGNPFRPVTLEPSWLTSTVVSLARQIYESRDFSAMPILADALQDAGCDNENILNHCRGGSGHVRGCFVVDLLLGKS